MEVTSYGELKSNIIYLRGLRKTVPSERTSLLNMTTNHKMETRVYVDTAMHAAWAKAYRPQATKIRIIASERIVIKAKVFKTLSFC